MLYLKSLERQGEKIKDSTERRRRGETMASIKANVKHVKSIFDCTIEAIEHKQKDGYGNGVYLEMLKNGKRWEGMHWQDCRYMINYEFKKAVEIIIKDFYGENLKALEFVEE